MQPFSLRGRLKRNDIFNCWVPRCKKASNLSLTTLKCCEAMLYVSISRVAFSHCRLSYIFTATLAYKQRIASVCKLRIRVKVLSHRIRHGTAQCVAARRGRRTAMQCIREIPEWKRRRRRRTMPYGTARRRDAPCRAVPDPRERTLSR